MDCDFHLFEQDIASGVESEAEENELPTFKPLPLRQGRPMPRARGTLTRRTLSRGRLNIGRQAKLTLQDFFSNNCDPIGFWFLQECVF